MPVRTPKRRASQLQLATTPVPTATGRPAQGGVVALLHGGEEGVGVQVDDGAGRRRTRHGGPVVAGRSARRERPGGRIGLSHLYPRRDPNRKVRSKRLSGKGAFSPIVAHRRRSGRRGDQPAERAEPRHNLPEASPRPAPPGLPSGKGTAPGSRSSRRGSHTGAAGQCRRRLCPAPADSQGSRAPVGVGARPSRPHKGMSELHRRLLDAGW